MNSEIKKYADVLDAAMEEMSDAIWDYAENRYQERKSSKYQEDFLEKYGFEVTKGIGGIETAFKAVYGEGHPVIGFLGEYDALPSLSQKADCTEESPVTEGACGHGCGHNLLGTADLQAACALKDYIAANKIPGTIIYFGCPAEESGAGKAFMVREGCFEGIDYALTWHPMDKNCVANGSLANARLLITFSGRAAHASGAPWNGRSALDACELTNVGVQYLREHVKPDRRMHYAYLNAGGTAPNVVQPKAQLIYALRAPHASYVKELIQRVSNVALGASIMTDTKVTCKVVSAYADFLAVPEMDRLMHDEMESFFPAQYTDEEIEYAAKFAKLGTESDADTVMNTELLPLTWTPESMGSTDVADVSWQVPTGQCYVSTMARGTVGHSWCLTAQGRSSIAKKGMHRAANILAQTGYRLLTDADARKRVDESFAKTKGKQVYESVLPPETKPGEF